MITAKEILAASIPMAYLAERGRRNNLCPACKDRTKARIPRSKHLRDRCGVCIEEGRR